MNPPLRHDKHKSMDYYRCLKHDLHRELTRRGFQAYGESDEAAERLKKDDEERGSLATTVGMVTGVPSSMPKVRENPEFGKTFLAELLAGERITHWTMNTLFPTLQLFFWSGLSCTIEGSSLPDAAVGLDDNLRFRLTDIRHEEDGTLFNGILPSEPPATPSSIYIIEATLACRTSIAVKETHVKPSGLPTTVIAEELHIVLGLRLQGMKEMGYVWARLPDAWVQPAGRKWGHVRLAGMKNDVPVPFVGFPQSNVKAGATMDVVTKGSMIAKRNSEDWS